VLIVRLLRPFVVIRFGPIRSPNFGHFVSEPEIYLSKRDVGLDAPGTFDIHYYTSRPGGLPFCNLQLKKMWDRTIRINRLARWPNKINRSLPGGSKHIVPEGNTRDIYDCMSRTPPHISFTQDEERLGEESLRTLGIPEGAEFVGFHARDSAWLEQLAPSLDFHYHDHRDSDIQHYIPAMRKLVDKGYFAIRMGSPVKDPLTTSDPQIIDYATNGSRTDFLDVYLGAKCKYFIGSAAGMIELPKTFRKPVVSVNWIPLEYAHSWSPKDLFIPKKLWLKSENRFLSFREILDSGIGASLNGQQYEELGIDPIENTPEEITAVVLEMEDRISGKWQTTSADEELQQRFWSLFDNIEVHYRAGEPLHGVIASRIGAEFLRRNQQLLD
jgi:putative glycosyltransferase (TIGR04372 family)